MARLSGLSRNRLMALGCLLLSPMLSSAFLLNLTFAPAQQRIAATASRSRGNGAAAAAAAAAAALAGGRRGGLARWSRCRSAVRLANAAGEGSGPSPKGEKVYKADDTLVRESDIENCRTYDECDLSPETLGTPFGDKKGTETATPTGAKEGYDRSRFHVHFGAGRLGLGLVVGA
ncbi:unnamed protein product, partial [Ectocarpus sp. 12 AP-2014]